MIPQLPEYDPGSMVVVVGPRDNFGKRAVTCRCRGRSHVDKFDTDDNYRRAKFRGEAANVFGVEDVEGFHEWAEQQIIDQARAADSKSAVELVTANVICYEDIEEQDTEWFWEPYIPFGAITVFASDPNEGKSTVLIDLAARNSRGDCPPPSSAPDNTYPCGNTLIIQGEDCPSRTSKQRLKAAGAIMPRVHHLHTVTSCDEVRPVQLPLDLPVIEKAIADLKINFVGVDVLSAFTEKGVSLNDDAAMRRLFNPMADLASRTQTAWVLIGHLNKKSGTAAMYRSGGSIAINGAARAAFTCAPCPDDPTRKVFAAVKHNLGPKPKSLTYHIEPCGKYSRIVWGEASDYSASDILNQPEQGKGGKVELAKSIISEVLAVGSRGENEVRVACSQAGVSRATYWRARKDMGVKSEKSAFEGEWLLSLPSTNGHEHEESHDEF